MADFEVLDRVLEQLQAGGLEPLAGQSSDLVVGRLARCRVADDRRLEQSGWYVLHEHRTSSGKVLYFGAFGNWRTGEKQNIKPQGVKLTPEERELMRARQEAAKRQASERRDGAARRAARRAAAVWERLPEQGRSAYLERKQVVGFGVRYGRDGTLLVPMRRAGAVVGLQVIAPQRPADGGRDKQYWPSGMQKEGAYCLIGPYPDPGEAVLVAEGYATGASLHMATSCAVAVAFDAGNLLAVGKALREQFPGRSLVFCADDDWQTRVNGQPHNTGLEKAENAAVILGGQVVRPVFSGERQPGWTDFNDLHGAEGLAVVRGQVMAVVQPAAEASWKALLIRTQQGGLVGHMHNVSLILDNDERWQGTLGYDEHSSRVMKLRTPPFGGMPGEWLDQDDLQTTKWLAQHYRLMGRTAAVLEGVNVTASQRCFHPVRDYLDSLVWDGRARLDHWLDMALGVRVSEYSLKVAARWMIAAVARVMQPGCKMDNVLILEGLQGEGKSQALKVLGGEWFMDTPFNLGDKEAFQQIRGKWIIELGELDAFNKAESTKAKQFFSAFKDTFRESYGRRSIDVLRQCVFAGTTNQEEYLKDPTGNRRYWPVYCTRINLELLRSLRDQLWAEALARYRAGERWWVEKDERALFDAEQEARFAVDAWEYLVLPWLEEFSGEMVTADQILGGALRLDYGHWGKPEQMRIGHIMNRLGWRRQRLNRVGPSGIRPWGYQKPVDWTAAPSAAKPVEPAF